MRTVARAGTLQCGRYPAGCAGVQVGQRVQRPGASVEIAGQQLAGVPRKQGYSPTVASPVRCRAMISSVKGRYSRGPLLARDQPPRTAGDQPTAPVLGFSQRVACTSSRPANNDRNKASFAACGELASTFPSGPSGPFWNRVGSATSTDSAARRASKPSSPRSRWFSARSCSSSASAVANGSRGSSGITPALDDRVSNQEVQGQGKAPRH